MLNKIFVIALAVLLMPIASMAATFTVTGGTASELPFNYNPSKGEAATIPIGTPITTFSSDPGLPIGGGLFLDAPSTIFATFIGKESTAANSLTLGGSSDSLSSKGLLDAAISAPSGSGFVDFSFETIIRGATETITNGGVSSRSTLSMAFSEVFNGGQSIYAFFGDSRGDSDYDDMVVRLDIGSSIAVVPLPASSTALGTGILAMFAFAAWKRRRT